MGGRGENIDRERGRHGDPERKDRWGDEEIGS